MQYLDISVESNGIVLFDKKVFLEYFNGHIAEGENLFKRFLETDEGDAVLKAGLIVPILAIDDLGYDVIIKYKEERCPETKHVRLKNGIFPISIVERACIADLYSLMNWKNSISTDFDYVDIEPGLYGVEILGYRIDDAGGNIEKAGYIFSFKREAHLPELTGKTGKPMRLLDL